MVFRRFGVIGSLVVLSLATGVIDAPADDLETLTGRMTEIGLRAERMLDSIRHDADHGVWERSHLAAEVDGARAALDGIEARLRALPQGADEQALAKLESVRRQVLNLAWAVERPETTPPAGATSGSKPVHKGAGRTGIGPDLPPANDDCSSAYDISFGSFVGSTAEATNDGEASCGSSIYSPDVWFNFIPTSSGTVVFDTVGSTFDSVISVHSGCPGTIANQQACNDDSLGLQGSVALTVYLGYEYRVRVSGFDGDAGDYVLNVTTGGEIRGTVVEGAGGTPIANPRMEVYRDDGYYLGYEYGGADGTYVFSGLPTGQFFVATDFTTGSYIDEIWDDHLCPGGPPYGCEPTIGDPVTLPSGAVVHGIDFALDEGGGITGTVLKEGGQQAVEGASVRIYDHDGNWVQTDTTDAAGMFLVTGLTAGTYHAAVLSEAWADEAYDDIPCPGGPPSGCDITAATPISVQLNHTTSGVDFGLQKLGSIEGRVTDRSTGTGLSYAFVRLYGEAGAYLDSVYTDFYGDYAIAGIADGTYFLVAESYSDYVKQLYDGIDCPPSGCNVISGTPVVVAGQNTASGIDFDLVEKGAITGTVRDIATYLPAPGVIVRVYDSSGNSVDYGSTDSSGVFLVDRLAEGTYFVATNDGRYLNILHDGIPCPQGCDPTSGTPVVVANGTTTGGIAFDLVPLGKITGYVYDGTNGAPISARVELYLTDGTYAGYDYTSGGRYDFAGLETADYFLVAEGSSSSFLFLEQLYDNFQCWGGAPANCDVTTGTPVRAIVSTVTSGIDFYLKHRPSISGEIVDVTTLQPVSGTVYAENLAGVVVGSSYTYNGSYTFTRLLPGAVRLIADMQQHRDQIWSSIQCPGEYPDHCSTAAGTVIAIGPGDVLENIDFRVDPLARLSGHVTDAVAGTSLMYVTVRVFDSQGVSVGYDSTDSSGFFEVSALWPGTYFAATDENGLTNLDELYRELPCPGGPGTGCNPTDGTPLPVSIGTVMTGIDFTLDPTATISGFVTDEVSGQPITSCYVRVWDEAGNLVRSDATDSTGAYSVPGLDAGVHFVSTYDYNYYSNYLDELWDDIPCYGGPPNGCDPTKGTPVTLAAGQTLRFIDFQLAPRVEGISGIVSNRHTGEPIPGIRVDLWDTSNGAYEGSVPSSAAGTYSFTVGPGTYVAATDNPFGLVNEIWDGIECPPGGSAWGGDCDPLLGDSILVAANRMTSGIDFDLRSSSALFSDGFETGDTARWSTTVP